MEFLVSRKNEEKGQRDFPLQHYKIDSTHERYQMPFHWHCDCEIIYIKSGKLTLTLNDSVFVLCEGESAFIPSEVMHAGAPENCVYQCVLFSLEKMLSLIPVTQERYIQKPKQSAYIPFTKINSAKVVHLFNILNSKNYGYEFTAQGLILQIIGEILAQKDVHDARANIIVHTKRMNIIKDVLRFIHNNYAKPVTLEMIADIAGLNPQYLCKFFKRITGRTPIDYLNYYRIECAAELLQLSEMNVTEIASICGFNDLSYFIKLFKKAKNMSPREFKNQRNTKVFKQSATFENAENSVDKQSTSYIPIIPEKPIIVDGIVTVHYFEYSNTYEFSGESHDFWELLYVDKGEVTVQANEKEHHLEKGQIIFHAPKEFHTVRSNKVTAPNIVVVSFICDNKNMDFFNEKILPADNVTKALLARIIKEAREAFKTPLNNPDTKFLERNEYSVFGAEQIICNCIEQLLVELIRHENIAENSHITSVITDATRNELFNRITEYMQNNVNKRLTVSQISKDNLVGQSYLQKIFKKATGNGVMDYFRKMKIDEAKKLIREGNNNFTQIAQSLNYDSVHYFSRHFKKQTGMTPTEFSLSIKAI